MSQRGDRERQVIGLVGRIVGSRGGAGFVVADDFVSDILLGLLNAGGFAWDDAEIASFCRKKCAYMVLAHRSRREISDCEFKSENDDGSPINVVQDVIAIKRANQELAFEAMQAAALLALLPDKHRMALEILAGGGTPLDVAQDLELKPWDAIVLIKEARQYLDRGGPTDEAA